MISSVFSLKEANMIPEYLVPNKETRLEENYYFNSCLDFLLECQNELLTNRRDFYKTVLEAGEENPYVINEAFNDIAQKIKNIIKKILAYIESIIKRFITAISKFVSSDKTIIKMKNQISKFPNNESFTISGYNYTLKEEIPAVDITGLDLSEVVIAVDDLTKDSGDISIKIAALTTVLSKFTSEEKLSEARSQILGVYNEIPDTSFANEVFAIYRDGKSSETDIEIKKADVTRAMNDYEGYKNKIKEVNRLRSNITSKYKSLESEVDNIIRSNIKPIIDGSTLDPKSKYTLTETMNILVNDMVFFIQKISNYHTMAIAGKLDAYNELVIQDRNILYKALSVVQKDINNTKIMENYDSYDYTRDAIYRGYIVERHYMNKEQQRFVEECLSLSESNIPELKTIHEDLKMDKKGKFEKLKELIKEIYQKFLMKMNSFFKNDKDFLAKYKDIILTKKIEEYKLNNMPDYEAGIKNVVGYKLKHLDIKAILGKTENDIKKELLPSFEGDDFADYAKKYFLSNNTANKEEVSSTTLKMEELYSFCVNAPATIKTLEADRDAYVKESEAAKKAVLDSISKNEAVDLYGEKYYYSTVHEAFINEKGENPDNGGPTIQDNKGSESSGEAKGNAKLNLNVSSEDKKTDKYDDMNKDAKSDEKGKDDKTQAEKNTNSDAKKVEETANWYLNALRTVATARITAFQKIYSEYMKILRYHVRKATGSMGNASKFTPEDEKAITAAMKEHLNGDDNAKKAAENKIINIYKSKGMVIDAHDVQNLVSRNKSALEA